MKDPIGKLWSQIALLMDSKPIQPGLRFKPLSSSSPPVEGMSDIHGMNPFILRKGCLKNLGYTQSFPHLKIYFFNTCSVSLYKSNASIHLCVLNCTSFFIAFYLYLNKMWKKGFYVKKHLGKQLKKSASYFKNSCFCLLQAHTIPQTRVTSA